MLRISMVSLQAATTSPMDCPQSGLDFYVDHHRGKKRFSVGLTLSKKVPQSTRTLF